MIKLPSILLLSQLLLPAHVSAVMMANPSGEDCWSDFKAIFTNEVKGDIMANITGYDVTSQRKYKLCSDTVYIVSSSFKDSGFSYETSAGWPLTVTTPNMHIYCESNCTVVSQLIAGSGAPLAVLPTSAHVASFLGDMAGDKNIASNADNSVIEGIKFMIANGNVGVDILSQTNNFTIKNCDIMGEASVGVRSVYDPVEFTSSYTSTVLISKSQFHDMKTTHSAVSTMIAADSEDRVASDRDFAYTLEDVVFNNVKGDSLVDFSESTSSEMHRVNITNSEVEEAMFKFSNRGYKLEDVTPTDNVVVNNVCEEPCSGEVHFKPLGNSPMIMCKSFSGSPTCKLKDPVVLTLSPTMQPEPTSSPTVPPPVVEVKEPDSGVSQVGIAGFVSAIMCVVTVFGVMA